MAKKKAAAANDNGATVTYIKKELQAQFPRYKLIEDCLGGQDVVKDAVNATTYLPTPDAFVALGEDRYTGYLARAVFYGVAERTLDGMVGEVFATEPKAKVPASLDKLIADITGGGLSVKQLAKQMVREVLAKGRCGLFADYPRVTKAATKKQLETGEVRPTLIFYSTRNVINWRTFKRGSRELLNLVVLREESSMADGPFGERDDIQYRVLRLEGETYSQEIWRDTSGANASYSQIETIVPLGFDGKPFNEVPFTFVGAKDNDATVDSAPLYSLCEMNMAHYRNSADFEDACFMLGQPIPWFAGMTKEWLDQVYPDGVATIGANGNILLPVQGSAGLLQVAPNTLVQTAMEMKERQMVALGARLVEQKTVQRTATEASIETASEKSVLASVAQNVGNAIKWGLEWCSWLISGQETGIEYELNSKYDLTKATPDEVRLAVEAWQKSALAFEEMRNVLRKADMASLEDDVAQNKIKDEVDLLPKLDDPSGGNNPDDDGEGEGEDTMRAAA